MTPRSGRVSNTRERQTTTSNFLATNHHDHKPQSRTKSRPRPNHNPQRPQPRPTNRRLLPLPNPPSPRTPRLRQNQDPNRARRLPPHPPWLPSAGCHLLHVYDQGEPGDAGADCAVDRGEGGGEVGAGDVSFHLSEVFGELWVFDWVAEGVWDCGFGG